MKKTFLTLALVSFHVLADVSPDYKTLLSLKSDTRLMPCDSLEGSPYCESQVETFDQKGNSLGKKNLPRFNAFGGEGSFFVVITSAKKIDEAICYYEFQKETFLKAPCKEKSVKDLFVESLSAEDTSTASLILNPKLKEVFTSKDARVPLPVNDIYNLKDIAVPEKVIGRISLTLNRSQTSPGVTLSYPGTGELIVPISKLAQAKEMKFPVIRIKGLKYLVQLSEEFVSGLGLNIAIASEFKESGNRYFTWVEANNATITFEAEKESPLASSGFNLKKGEDFQHGSETWTQLKLSVMYPDFDKKYDEEEIGLPYKKVYLRAIFLPLLNSDKEFNLWPEWTPGC